mgnify:FL=1|tara:strand:+ start:105 stop:329 length:225 start_codon:yes stop_codon:yes gene_type:complete
MTGTLQTPNMPVISISNRDRITPIIKVEGIQSKSAEPSTIVQGVSFPFFETSLIISGVFVGILTTLSLAYIFQR